jgi:hypothetical protein
MDIVKGREWKHEITCTLFFDMVSTSRGSYIGCSGSYSKGSYPTNGTQVLHLLIQQCPCWLNLHKKFSVYWSRSVEPWHQMTNSEHPQRYWPNEIIHYASQNKTCQSKCDVYQLTFTIWIHYMNVKFMRCLWFEAQIPHILNQEMLALFVNTTLKGCYTSLISFDGWNDHHATRWMLIN